MSKAVLFKKVGLVMLLAIWAGATAWLGWSYYQNQQNTTQNDAKVIVDKIRTLMEVPAEEPLVATITDAEKLKTNEPFYKNAQNGDKVLIWKEKAVIYRMEQNKIVDFGVVIRQPQSASPNTTTPIPPTEETETTESQPAASPAR